MYIIAHRANTEDKYKENSLEAIKSALKKEYIDGIEIDIRITKDNYFVLNHNALYAGKIIKNTSIKELNKLDELDNVLKNIKTHKIILIDIKCEEIEYINIVKPLINILKKYKKLNIYLCSFNYELSKYLKINTKYKVGIFISNIINKNKKTTIFDFVAINYKIYKPVDKTTMIWTVNKEEIFKKYLNKKIYIITDKPQLILKNY